MSPGRPGSPGRCRVYTHLNWCLRPACSSGLLSRLMNEALRAGATEWGPVVPFLGLSASTICIWASLPWSASAAHWLIFCEVLRRVSCETPASVRSYHHHQGHQRLVLQARIETVRAARSPNLDPAISSIYSSKKHLPTTSCGKRAVPGAVWGNQANRTKSDSVTAISHLFLSDPLTLPYPPVGFGASLALPGAQWEEKTQSGD